jgi:hypothetical protein
MDSPEKPKPLSKDKVIAYIKRLGCYVIDGGHENFLENIDADELYDEIISGRLDEDL